ncbi:MAG: hypothetical protein JW837_05740 [Sedimentisphaerales bacterium]|nr:hypothetical protein [Sedimentisphaerales bacterium]
MTKYIDEIFALKKEENNKEVSTIILNHFREKIEGMLIRYNSIDEREIKNSEYKNLVMEARELYFQEFYYSCVVMSCSVAEFILRKMFFNNIKANKKHLSKKTQKYLSFIRAKAICEFLVCENIIQKNLLASFKILGELYSKYSNIIAKTPKEDAERALYHLHKILKQVNPQVLLN